MGYSRKTKTIVAILAAALVCSSCSINKTGVTEDLTRIGNAFKSMMDSTMEKIESDKAPSEQEIIPSEIMPTETTVIETTVAEIETKETDETVTSETEATEITTATTAETKSSEIEESSAESTEVTEETTSESEEVIDDTKESESTEATEATDADTKETDVTTETEPSESSKDDKKDQEDPIENNEPSSTGTIKIDTQETTDETKSDKTKDETKDETKTEEPKVGETKVEETKVEESKSEENKVDEETEVIPEATGRVDFSAFTEKEVLEGFIVEEEKFEESFGNDEEVYVKFSGKRILVSMPDNKTPATAINLMLNGFYQEAEGAYNRYCDEKKAELELTSSVVNPVIVKVSYSYVTNSRIIVVRMEYSITEGDKTTTKTELNVFDMLTAARITNGDVANDVKEFEDRLFAEYADMNLKGYDQVVLVPDDDDEYTIWLISDGKFYREHIEADEISGQFNRFGMLIYSEK